MIIKILKKKFNSIKICAVFTAVCFMVSTLGANLYAIPMTENANQKYDDVFNKASSISNEYGKITSSKDAQSDITVINIQDLHCHPQTQRNIAKIIGQIADKYNLKKVYVEGGYGDIDVSWLGSIKDENIKKKIIEELVEEGILTGSEYYKLISNNDKVELKGIDERQLHQDNIKRLSLIIENQDKYKELSKKINKEISFLEQKYVNIRNKRFNNNIEDYLSGKIDTRRFYRQLLKYIKDINANTEEYNNVTAIRLEDYPNISKFMTLRKVSKNINVRDVTQQLQIVLNELKSRMPYNTYTRLLKETDNFSDSQKVVELVTLLCEKEGIDLDRKYKALSEFLNSNEINRELNTVELVYEERQLITEIRKALSYNNEEYEITFVSDFSRYFQDYLEYKLTDADWKYFESEYKQFRQLYGKYATVDRIKEIESDIAELNKYYEINDQRNEIFVNNLLQDEEPTILQQSKLRQDEEILKQSKEVIIAVTGGFHSQALEEILQAKEVNTIVITPSIFEGIEKATKQYKGIIKEQSKEFQHQALAYTLASCSDSVVYKRIKDREQVPSDYAIVREEEDGSVVVAEHFQKRILLNAVVRILGTKDVAKIREVLEPIMGKEALTNLEEDINNLEDIGEKFDAKYEPFRNAIDAAVDSIVDSIQTTGNLVLPDQATIDRAMTGLVTSLISVGQIYFSNGVIFEIENSEFYGKDLAGIPAEIYSRMMPTFQRALLLFQASRTSTVPLNTSSLESDDKIVIVQPRQAADGKTETYDEELSLTVEDLLYIGLNDDNEWSFLTPKSVSERTENLRERKRQTGILSKAEKKLKENQVPNYTGDVVDLRIKLKKAQLNKQVVYLSDIFGRQVLIKRKDNNGNDVYCEAIIKYNEETRQWELVPFEEINARYKSIEDGLLSKIEDFTKQFEGKTPEEILKKDPAILQLVILAVVRGFDIDNTFLDNKTLTLGGVKGYFAEYLVKYFTETYLDDQYRLAMPIDSNQEGFDLIDKDGYRIQIKAAAKRIDNADPDKRDIVGHALHKFKGIPVFATSEIASEYKADTDMVFSYGFSHEFIESIAKVAFDILNNLTPQEKEDLKTKTTGKVIETRYLSEFLKDKDLEARAQQERANDEQEEVRIRGSRNEQKKADIKTVDAAVYQTFIDLLKSKLNIADEQVTMQPKLGVEEKTQQEEIQQEETATPKRSKLSIFDSRRGEGKIFDFLDATAPLWEELYRFIPTVLSIGLYSVAILPFLPALGWTAIPITIGISFAVFNMFQRNFIKKHIITDWLKTKDSDIEEIKTWKEFLSFLYERIKIYTFEIFPSKLEKEQFENFYKNDDAAVAHRNGLMVPTIGISLPYLILICAMTICSTIPSFQIIMIVTLVASLIHYANNKLIETGFSLFPKEKEKQKDLRYIRGRLQYVRLLLEYPQLKNNLPVIKSGPRAEKYGVETLKERRAEYLEQFESIRQKLIKEAEKDHPKIKQELILMDAKKVSETIDAIDKLLPIFEEIDNIVDLIEEYKDNYEGARETREIEKAFFIFVSDVLSTELMSIYDTKVTGDHVRRMVAFANVLGEIAYPDASLKFRYRLMLAALFHDIGKNLIPDSVLNSQNGFDATEKHIMDFHSVFGDIILRASILQKLGYFAGNHHAAKNAKRGYSYESKLREISEQPIDFKRDENDKAEDDLILEIIALADVYEALSPKLSMDSERLYQLPSRIESIKNILAALDFRGNLTEQKKAVKLLEEIAAIEQEKDETTKQKKEKEFVEKVLYSNNTDSLLMYIRNKNEDLIRNRAFKIIFTQDQNTLFDLFEEDKDKFIKDLTANPEIVKIMSLELIDWTKFEFDEEAIGAFLEFYFTSMDVDINNQIIDEMGYRKKENAVSLYIRNAILNFRKRQRERQKKLQRILSKYTPVKLSIVDGLREKGAGVSEDVTADKAVAGESVGKNEEINARVKRPFSYTVGEAEDFTTFLNKFFEITVNGITSYIRFRDSKRTLSFNLDTDIDTESKSFTEEDLQDTFAFGAISLQKTNGEIKVSLSLKSGYSFVDNTTTKDVIVNKKGKTFIKIKSQNGDEYLFYLTDKGLIQVEYELGPELDVLQGQRLSSNLKDLQQQFDFEFSIGDNRTAVLLPKKQLEIFEFVINAGNFNRQFMISFSDGSGEYNFIFNPNTNSLFKFSESGNLEEINESDYARYGIKEFTPADGKIVSFTIEEGTNILFPIRQPVGMTETEIEENMRHLAESRDPNKIRQLRVLEQIDSLNKTDIISFFDNFPENIKSKIVVELNNIEGETIAPEKLVNILKNLGFLDEDAKMYVERILSRYIKANINNFGLSEEQIDKFNKGKLCLLSPYQMKRVLIRSGVPEKELKNIRFVNGVLSKETKDALMPLLARTNLQDELKTYKNQLRFILLNIFMHPSIISMFIYALYRGCNNQIINFLKMDGVLESAELKKLKDSNFKNLTLRHLILFLQYFINLENAEQKDGILSNIVGFFGEVYCVNTLVAGEFDGIKLRLQLPEDSHEEGIDLFDPITGMKVQVKTPHKGLINKVNEHYNSFLIANSTNPQLGLRKVPALTIDSVAEEYQRTKEVTFEERKKFTKGFEDLTVITNLINAILNLVKNINVNTGNKAFNYELEHILEVFNLFNIEQVVRKDDVDSFHGEFVLSVLSILHSSLGKHSFSERDQINEQEISGIPTSDILTEIDSFKNFLQKIKGNMKANSETEVIKIIQKVANGDIVTPSEFFIELKENIGIKRSLGEINGAKQEYFDLIKNIYAVFGADFANNYVKFMFGSEDHLVEQPFTQADIASRIARANIPRDLILPEESNLTNMEEESVQEENVSANIEEQASEELAVIKLEDIKKNFFTGQRVLVVLPNGNTYEMSVMDNRIDLNVGDGEMYKIPLDSSAVESLMGIKLRINDDGETVSLVKTDKFKERTQLYILDDADITEIEPNVEFTRKELDAIYSDTGAEGYVDIYLDEDESTLKQKIKEASDSNKLLVFHFFETGATTQKMTYSQIFKRYKKIASLIDKVLVHLFPIGGEQMITQFGASFYLREMLKNALVHGNLGKLEEPIAMYIKFGSDGTTVQKASVYNKVSKGEKISNELKTLAVAANLTGEHKGIEIMRNNALRKYDDNGQRPITINDIQFYKASITMLPYVDQAGVAWEKAYFNKLNNPSPQSFWYDSILPENMGIVNRMLQQGRSALGVAVWVAFKEFKASLKPNFVDLHQSESGRKGAQQLRNFITRFDVVETDGIATRIIKTILGTIVKGASIVKHITIDYRFIKASGITEAIKMFGSNTYLDENGNVHIPPVMIVDDLQQVQGELIPTGISVNGRSIYQVAESGMLIYGAQGIDGVDVSKAINESQMIKDAIENMIRAKGYEGIKVEVEGVIQEEGEGVRFEDGITIIGTQELQGKSVEYVNGFVSSSLEIKRSMGVMYSQKALISLESMDDMEKLEQALKQGRARKIISKSQYEQLQLTPEEIITMRENGIEIYVDSNEIDSNLKENGIVGQIIRKDGQIFIHDYYAQEEVEVEEIGEGDSLLNIENKLVNSQKPILIDIKVLAKQFQKENILGVYKGLNTLIGNIKIKTGIGTINQADIENLAYNIDYNKIPDLGTLSKEKLETLTVDELIEILNIAENSEIRIILKAIRKNQDLDENGFVNIIKERILAKAVLKENNKEFGLKDKKMEILLGKMLLKQLGNQDKQNVNIPDSFTGEKDNVIKKIMEETDKAMRGDEVAVNTIIEIILVYGDSYKNKQMAKELDANDARNYRAMMAAA